MGDIKQIRSCGVLGSFSFLIIFILVASVANSRANALQNNDKTSYTATATPNNLFKNDTKIQVTLDLRDVKLSEALLKIAKKANVGLSFDREIIPPKNISYNFHKKALYAALQDLLAGTNLTFTLSSDRETIIIQKRPPVIQKETVSGTVTDAATGDPLIGVNILVVGTTSGTVTGTNGHYSLDVPSLQDTLRFSYIGYRSEIIAVKGRTTINVTLKNSITNLNQLVVTGIGGAATQRRNLATATTRISAEDLTETTTPVTVTGALTGKLPGVSIKSMGGAPGGGFNVKIRGISTIQSGNSQPLYIVDGVYVQNAPLTSGRSIVSSAGGAEQDVSGNRLADINPQNIESIQVLKGPAAAAIYGERANAGVVIITTKRGAAGDTKVKINQSIGFEMPLKLLGVASWNVEKIKKFYSGARQALEIQRFKEAKTAGHIYNYEKILYGHKRPVSKTSVQVSGGNSTTQFYISGGYNIENGIIKNTNFKRSSIRANIDHKVTKGIEVTTSSYFVKSNNNRGFSGNQNGTGASVPYALNWIPTYAQLFPDSKDVFPDNPYFSSNPLALQSLGINNQKITRTIQSLNLNINLLNKKGSALSFITQTGLDFINSKSVVYLPNILQSQKSLTNPGDLVRSQQNNLNINLRSLLKYKRDLQHYHFITQIGFTRSYQKSYLLQTRGRGLVPGQMNIKQAKVQSIPAQFIRKIQSTGLYAQQQINWEDRLIGILGVRFDRSSLNIDQSHYYAYPQASLAFNISNFNFFNIKPISYLKLRVAYGQTGGAPKYGSIYSELNGVNIGTDLGLTRSSRDIDPNLKPERGVGIEFGLNANFLSNRINLSVTRYIKTIRNLILDEPTAASTGIINIATNAGTLKNKGIEIGLKIVPVQMSNFVWNSYITFWSNKSRITKLDIPPFTTGGYGTSLGNMLIQEGFSPTTIVSRPATPGEKSLFTIYGNEQPNFEMSFNESFSFLKNFQFSFLFHLSEGNYNVSLNPYHRDKAGTTPDYDTKKGEKRRSLEYFGEKYIYNASYLKLEQVGLHYTIPFEAINKVFGSGISSIRMGISANDVFMITPYPSYDVGASSFGISALNGSMANAPYPAIRKVLFNIQVTF